jgi:hypothetical protein
MTDSTTADVAGPPLAWDHRASRYDKRLGDGTLVAICTPTGGLAILRADRPDGSWSEWSYRSLFGARDAAEQWDGNAEPAGAWRQMTDSQGATRRRRYRDGCWQDLP